MQSQQWPKKVKRSTFVLGEPLSVGLVETHGASVLPTWSGSSPGVNVETDKKKTRKKVFKSTVQGLVAQR